MAPLVVRLFLVIISVVLANSWPAELRAAAQTPPLSLSISAAESVVKAGSDVRVDIAITNVSQHEITFLRTPGVGRGELDAELEVTDEHGNATQMTKYWESLKKYGIERVEGSRISIVLKPGESFKTSVALNKLYDLNRAGNYTIYAKKRVPDYLGGGVVESNVVTITVTTA